MYPIKWKQIKYTVNSDPVTSTCRYMKNKFTTTSIPDYFLIRNLSSV